MTRNSPSIPGGNLDAVTMPAGPTKVPLEVHMEIERAFHAADNVIRAQPEEWQDEIVDRVLHWAIASYLPCSKYFKGMFAYTVHPDDCTKYGSGVVLLHAQRPDNTPVEPAHVAADFEAGYGPYDRDED